MTFEEWFDSKYPEDLFGPYQMSRETIKDIMSVAWAASRENLRTWDL